jgi:hypothetical protein
MEGFERLRKRQSDTTDRKWKKKAGVCREFGPVNSTIETTGKSINKFVSAFEQNWLTIERFSNLERSEAGVALLRRFNP